MKRKRQFAASGSCFAEAEEIHGTVKGITFTSKLFTGTMDSQKFWDDLAALAKARNKFIRLMY